MFETYRMLGEDRELELFREARRLHAGRAGRRRKILSAPKRRPLRVNGNPALALLARLRCVGSAV
jgi:hypothetical protein